MGAAAGAGGDLPSARSKISRMAARSPSRALAMSASTTLRASGTPSPDGAASAAIRCRRITADEGDAAAGGVSSSGSVDMGGAPGS